MYATSRPKWNVDRITNCQQYSAFVMYRTVMWSETVGLRTRPVRDPKKSVLVLIGLQFWCRFVKTIS